MKSIYKYTLFLVISVFAFETLSASSAYAFSNDYYDIITNQGVSARVSNAESLGKQGINNNNINSNIDFSGISPKPVKVDTNKPKDVSERMYYDDDDYFGIDYKSKIVPIISQPLSDDLSDLISVPIHRAWPDNAWHVFDAHKELRR